MPGVFECSIFTRREATLFAATPHPCPPHTGFTASAGWGHEREAQGGGVGRGGAVRV